jgi:two-component system, NtrC family, sensor kinase
MQPTDEARRNIPLLRRWRRSLGTKLIAILLVAIGGCFALQAYLVVRLHRRHLEAQTEQSALRMSDVIKRSTSDHMLKNDREALYRIIQTMGAEPGIVRIRIFNQEGRISYSTHAAEMGTLVEKEAEACYGCHAHGAPLAHLDRPDRIRIYRTNGQRVMGVINPIENQPSCSSAPCHAHDPNQKILGVLDTNLSLAQADESLAQSEFLMLVYVLLAAAGIAVVSGYAVLHLVEAPLRTLKEGTHRLALGELGFQIPLPSNDEVGELAGSFNRMSLELEEARSELTSWNEDLERRVQKKTQELQQAHAQVVQSERLASVGKLAAVVAHEINNPLSGVLTYAKLLRKWVERGEIGDKRLQEMRDSLELIESEVRRCGDVVRNMLMFARTSSASEFAWADLNDVARRALRLVQHKMELAAVRLQAELAEDLPRVHCDAAQVEQVVLALLINAVEAMPGGGTLGVRTGAHGSKATIEITDTGAGIPPEVLDRIFEPFVTTKDSQGLGLGLAVSKQIADRHHGELDVRSTPGGTTCTLVLRVGAEAPAEPMEVR